jgi:hypothetical protein
LHKLAMNFFGVPYARVFFPVTLAWYARERRLGRHMITRASSARVPAAVIAVDTAA